MRIGLVIATRNRSRVLAETLEAVRSQTRPPEAIVVVDNDSADDTLARLGREFPEVLVVKAGDNVGVNGGLALGLRALEGRGLDAFWMLDDDTVPPPDSLEELEEALSRAPGVSGVGYQGGTIRWGAIRHYKTPEQVRRLPSAGPGLREVDFFLVDGALVRREPVDAVGYPPEDYFMMIGDVEYPYRMTRAGFRLAVFERDRLHRATLGGKGDASGKPAWRAYYKARNQVRMALDYRSPLLLVGALLRIARLALAYARPGRGDGPRARALLRGALDGFLGRMGRTVEPTGP
jgi:rhamnopyranosyl-N-acetylglucosaminyl-diphospho-decaprenol beta-1,3/1,4-galactofuranosyltransferase